MGYTFKAEWLKGTFNKAPDMLSRHPTSDPLPEELLAEQDLDNHTAPTTAEVGDHNSLQIQGLREAAVNDQEYQKVKHYIHNGFPNHHQNIPKECRRYWNVRAQLLIEDDLIVYGCCLLIPATLRWEILTQLHDSHQGMVRMKESTALCLLAGHRQWHRQYSPLMQASSAKTYYPPTLITKPVPAWPFQELAGDFGLYAGRLYLILVDCFSDWPDIIPMGTTTTAMQLTSALRASFCCTGVPTHSGQTGGHSLPPKPSEICAAVGLSAHYIITSIPTEQRQGRGYGEIDEEANLRSMERTSDWWKPPSLCSTAVP